MLSLKQTCSACPEQYDVYDGETKVGYIRLRHGYFRAECGGNVVYSTTDFQGDGCFSNDLERRKHLNLACMAIKQELESIGEQQYNIKE